jgi:hypothetical protein
MSGVVGASAAVCTARQLWRGAARPGTSAK